MPSREKVDEFIASTFCSVWTLELLILLRKEGGRSLTPEQMVSALRASELVVTQGVKTLQAIGLVVTEGDGSCRYQPSAVELETLVAATEDRYVRSPGSVRRIIVGSGSRTLTAFADAFRLRGN